MRIFLLHGHPPTFKLLMFTIAGLISARFFGVLQCIQLSQVHESIPFQSSHPDQAVINPKTGRAERVFVNLEAVYPNMKDPSLEISFEELRATRRGWTSKTWRRPSPEPLREAAGNRRQQQQPENTIHIGRPSQMDKLANDLDQKASMSDNGTETISSFEDRTSQSNKPLKTKKTKVREVKQETQTGEG